MSSYLFRCWSGDGGGAVLATRAHTPRKRANERGMEICGKGKGRAKPELSGGMMGWGWGGGCASLFFLFPKQPKREEGGGGKTSEVEWE